MAWVIKDDCRFYLHEGETLLDGLLRTKQTARFECCQGYCGACKLKIAIQRGTVWHTIPPLCQLNDDEVLACCCMVSGVIRIL